MINRYVTNAVRSQLLPIENKVAALASTQSDMNNQQAAVVQQLTINQQNLEQLQHTQNVNLSATLSDLQHQVQQGQNETGQMLQLVLHKMNQLTMTSPGSDTPS